MSLLGWLFGTDNNTSSSNSTTTETNTRNDVKTNTTTTNGDNNTVENVGGNLTKTDGKAWELGSKAMDYVYKDSQDGRRFASEVLKLGQDLSSDLVDKNNKLTSDIIAKNTAFTEKRISTETSRVAGQSMKYMAIMGAVVVGAMALRG